MIADAEKTKGANQGFWNIVKANLRNFSMFLVLGLIMVGFAFLTGGVNLNPRSFTYIFI